MATTRYPLPAAVNVAALASDFAFATLRLSNVTWGGSVDVASSITGGSLSRTIEGASTLQVILDDPDWRLLNSGVFDLRGDGRLNAVDVTVDTLGFRLVKVEPLWDVNSSQVTLTFEEREVALLRAHDSPIAVSRSAMTRARFVRLKLVREVKAEQIAMISPEEFEVQPVDQPKEWQPDANGQTPAGGFTSGAKIQLQKVTADADQLRNLTIAMQVADVHQAPDLARLAMVCAGIGESVFRAIPNSQGSGYAGVFQANPAQIAMNDTAGQAKAFLLGGQGFQGGGAITLAKTNPGWTPGHIAYVVEGSRQNFRSDSEAEHHYEQYHGEATAVLAAWSGATGTQRTRTSVRQYQFTRGLPGKRETSWDAMQRLASEVGWRCFVARGIVYFVSEEWLFQQPADAVIDLQTDGLNGVKGDWDEGKTEQQVTLTVDAGRWDHEPGKVIALRDMGPCTGRWLVHTIDRADIFDPTTEITLTKPLPRLHEPAASLITVSNAKAASSGVARQPGSTGWGRLISGAATFAGYDQGVDFTGKGTVYVLDDCVITRVESSGSGWPGEGAIVVYRLTAGDAQGRFVYTAEDFSPAPGLQVGTAVKRGQPLGTATGSGRAPGIETGFAQDAHGSAYGSPSDGKGSNPPNPQALAFGKYAQTGKTT